MAEEHANRPIITMSMAATGVISRLAGEVFGSCLTFGAAKKASAPGQMGVNDLKTVLETLHKKFIIFKGGSFPSFSLLTIDIKMIS